MGVVVAVDGGGSKTDAVVLSTSGAVLGRARGTGSSPQVLGLEAAIAVFDAVVREALAAAGQSQPDLVRAYMSGVDLPEEFAAFHDAVAALPWAPASAQRPEPVEGQSAPASLVVDNDLVALLRAGTAEPDAVAVVCGTGVNAVGVRRDGAIVRFPALGMISGDWGGGWHLGEQALWHAARAVDGRGPATALVVAIPAVFGLGTIEDVIRALHFRDIPNHDLSRISPAVFACAAQGDEVAASLVDRQSGEIVTFAVTALRRLDLLDAEVPVVLGGGVIAGGDERLMSGIRAGLDARAPRARIVHVEEPPVVGAALLALAAAGADAAALARAEQAVLAVPAAA
ncbi:N-acetylglucosamine kinase [Microbacterium mangrovi]|uniref:N-acetylglucosamine kinase n=1 Tax=Microbacterium mangrovi TaxID=1348253 RepID=A0A0B2A2J6_9MICO|nr:BadF/BadG/BcrA/BcrD ATPase family protein [Microbacterium mangrovi]KHK95758.1 N-acetylglucosamine kinase [Microbacterium mangrovi]